MSSSALVTVFYLICFAAVCRCYSIDIENKTEQGSPVPFGIDSRISGAANVGDVPSQVSIQYRNLHICGGVLINDKTVLTAATCLLSTHLRLLDPKHMRVLAGGIWVGDYPVFYPETNPLFDDKRQYSAVNKIFIHPSFNTKKKSNNIAIIQVATSFTESNIEIETDKSVPYLKFAPLQTTTVPDGLPCEVSGWGFPATGATPELSRTLKKQEAIIGIHETCSKSFPSVDDNMICAGTNRYQGSVYCDGDVGGPLFCNNELVGIASNTTCETAATVQLGVYMEIRPFIDWIKETKSAAGNSYDDRFNSAVTSTGSFLFIAVVPVVLALFK